MKKLRTHLHSFALLLALCILLCTSALAASGFLRVVIVDDGDDYVPGMDVEVCLVAAYENGEYALAEDFADLDLTAAELNRDLSLAQAEKIYEYVVSSGIEGAVQTTDDEGAAEFAELSDGIYLVFERGGQNVSFRPYFVVMPRNEGGKPEYSIYSVPKIIIGERIDITVIKIWDDDNNAMQNRPQELDVTLCRGGEPVRSVTLNEECDWRHTFYSLPRDGSYTLEEANLADYTASCVREGNTFTLTNTYEPPQSPDGPELPDTGFKMLPVYLLLICGSALVIFGLADLCLKREEK